MNATAVELFEQWLPVLADLDTPLLLYGEPGVGADELAAAVHTLGRRRHGPLSRSIAPRSRQNASPP